jgi:hypothetical protein
MPFNPTGRGEIDCRVQAPTHLEIAFGFFGAIVPLKAFLSLQTLFFAIPTANEYSLIAAGTPKHRCVVPFVS